MSHFDTEWVEKQRAFVAERTRLRARLCTCGHTAGGHEEGRGVCLDYKTCGCMALRVKEGE